MRPIAHLPDGVAGSTGESQANESEHARYISTSVTPAEGPILNIGLTRRLFGGCLARRPRRNDRQAYRENSI